MTQTEYAKAKSQDPAVIARLKADILASKQARQDAKKAAKADVTSAPVKAAKKASPKVAAPKPAPAKTVAAKPSAPVGKVLNSRPDTDLICVTDTGTGSSLAGVGYELSPMKYNGEWTWAVPGHAEAQVRGNALLRHPGYVRAGRFFAVVRNSQAALEEAVRTRIRSKAAGAATSERRTQANLDAYRKWVTENAAVRPA